MNLPYVILLKDNEGVISYRPAMMSYDEFYNISTLEVGPGIQVVGAIPRAKLQEMIDDIDAFQKTLPAEHSSTH